jgi:hypothetical protein
VANAAGETASANFTVSISGRNDSPVARDDSNSLSELASQNSDGNFGTVTGNVLSNDTDVDNNSLSVLIILV